MIVIGPDGVRRDMGPAKPKGGVTGSHRFDMFLKNQRAKEVQAILKHDTSAGRLGMHRKECADCGRRIDKIASSNQPKLVRDRYCAMCLEDRKDERLKGLRA